MVVNRNSEWCDLWGMRLNASKTKTTIVSRSRTMQPLPPPIYSGQNCSVPKESVDLDILDVTFDAKEDL